MLLYEVRIGESRGETHRLSWRHNHGHHTGNEIIEKWA